MENKKEIKTLDFQKFLCDWLSRTQYKHLVTEVNDALEKQGLEFRDNLIVSKQSNPSEFKVLLDSILNDAYDYCYFNATTTEAEDYLIKSYSDKILTFIADSIKVEDMVADLRGAYNGSMKNAYKKGIEDTIEKIKKL